MEVAGIMLYWHELQHSHLKIHQFMNSLSVNALNFLLKCTLCYVKSLHRFVCEKESHIK